MPCLRAQCADTALVDGIALAVRHPELDGGSGELDVDATVEQLESRRAWRPDTQGIECRNERCIRLAKYVGELHELESRVPPRRRLERKAAVEEELALRRRAVKAVKVVEAVEAVKGVEAVAAVKPVEAVKGAEAVEAVKPVEAVKGVEAAKDVKAVEAVGTAKAVEAVKAVEGYYDGGRLS